MATVQCGGPPTRAKHVTMPARLLRGDVLQCGAASAGARGRRGVCGEPAHLPLGPSRFSWPPTCCFCPAFSPGDSGFLPSRSVYAAPSHRRTSPPPSPPAAAGCMCGPGGRTHAPPRPPWAAVAALLALGSPHDPALDYTYLTLRMTLRYAALRYATLLLVAGCSSSPAAAARRSRPPRLRPSSSPASCACCIASRCSFASRRLLRLCVFLLPQPVRNPRRPLVGDLAVCWSSCALTTS